MMNPIVVQINTKVGDLRNNYAKMKEIIEESIRESVEDGIFIFPEMVTTGYPIKDLAYDKVFIEQVAELDRDFSAFLRNLDTAAIWGSISMINGKLYNVARTAYGHCHTTIAKTFLPNYDVFDEKRWFSSDVDNPMGAHYDPQYDDHFKLDTPPESRSMNTLVIRDTAILICEDIWPQKHNEEVQQMLMFTLLKYKGIKQVIVINGSPYYRDKHADRMQICQGIFDRLDLEQLVYVNKVGGEEDLIFDGSSFIISRKEVRLLPSFEEVVYNFEKNKMIRLPAPQIDGMAFGPLPHSDLVNQSLLTDLKALIYGTREYCIKGGFNAAVVGLSGGADSSLVAWILEKAIGFRAVNGLIMNTKFNSEQTVKDQDDLKFNMGENLRSPRIYRFPIDGIFEQLSLEAALCLYNSTLSDITLENIQARLRGLILMAFSNETGRTLVAGTGNKSELAVGHCTLYGDMSCGLAIISDVYKTDVFKMLKIINIIEGREVIPESVITKPPSAELKANQKDTDVLPDYEVLDPIIEKCLKYEALDATNPTHKLVYEKIRRNEFKRRQAAPGLKISRQAFGYGRRYPILSFWSPFAPDRKSEDQ